MPGGKIVKIANGVEMLQIEIEAYGNRAVFNPALIWDEDSAILVDTGMPGQLEAIRSAMDAAGVSFDQLTAVILTHQDLDHIGSLPDILREANGHVEVYAHEKDKPFIEGTLPLLKTDPERMDKEAWESLPEPARALYANPPKANVDKTVSDGQELPFCGGIRIIYTPGHTPGHISLYVERSKTLIAGDSMLCINGTLSRPAQQHTPDMETALKSLGKYLDYDIDAAICYHGGLSEKLVNEQIQKLAKNNN
jgi:glyoxylase-like metal-dependent hydrolase (beta-lactamase superfamily II)